MSLLNRTWHGLTITRSLPLLATQKRTNTRESIHRYVEPEKFKKHMLAASEPYFKRRYELPSETCRGLGQKEGNELHPLQQIYVEELLKTIADNDFTLFIQHNYTPFQSERVYKNTLIKSGGVFLSHRNVVYKKVFAELGIEDVQNLFVSRNSLVSGMIDKLPACVTALSKMPQFILLGGCINKEVYSSRQLQIISKSPNLDLCRANLVSILETPAIDLASNLEEYVKMHGDVEQEPEGK